MRPQTPHLGQYLFRLLAIFATLGLALFFLTFGASGEQGTRERQRVPTPRPTPQSYEINVGGYKFDPQRGEPQIGDAMRAVRPAQQPAYQIVQFNKSLTREERTRLQRSYGLRLNKYVPNLVGSSRVDLQACKLEYSIVSPK